jgi:hypothetical protein
MKRDAVIEIPIEEFGAEMRFVLGVLTTGEAFTRDTTVLMRKGFSDNFTRQGTDEAPWPPRRRRTRGRSGNPNRPLLIDLGDLYEGVAETGRGHVDKLAPRDVGSGVDPYAFERPYPLFLQEGTQFMEPRPFIALGEERLTEIDGQVADTVLAQL